uniref:Uncharacterized protein n=1 Tax=Ditylenchus dipsaci TaxID=166011 RepID=A0A915D3P8_9BILA
MNMAAKPDEGQQPTNEQLFFIDTSESLEKRKDAYSECDINILNLFEKYLRDHNPYAKAYMMMSEIEKEEEILAIERGEQPKELKMVFNTENKDIKRYNTPTSNEVAAVFICDADGSIPQANIVVHEREKR